MRATLAFLICAGLLMAAGCSDTPTSPSTAVFSASDLRAGTGTEATKGSTVTVHYTLWLYDAVKTDHKGAQVESSVGGSPFSFVLGNGDVIAGWDQGVPGMKVGGIRRLVVPPSQAYGDTRRNAIPPFSTLLFDIELVAVGQ